VNKIRACPENSKAKLFCGRLLPGGFFNIAPLPGKRIMRIDSRFSKTVHSLQYLPAFSLKLSAAGV
jgi:hypothetical protein